MQPKLPNSTQCWLKFTGDTFKRPGCGNIQTLEKHTFIVWSLSDVPNFFRFVILYFWIQLRLKILAAWKTNFRVEKWGDGLFTPSQSRVFLFRKQNFYSPFWKNTNCNLYEKTPTIYEIYANIFCKDIVFELHVSSINSYSLRNLNCIKSKLWQCRNEPALKVNRLNPTCMYLVFKCVLFYANQVIVNNVPFFVHFTCAKLSCSWWALFAFC